LILTEIKKFKGMVIEKENLLVEKEDGFEFVDLK
jgi:hypothetical protein